MRKTRNSFFAESSYQSYNPNGMNMNGGPYQTGSNYFYQGPGPMPNYYNTPTDNNDIESRFAKMERQINRLDYRITKLENTGNTITADDYENNSTNMYML